MHDLTSLPSSLRAHLERNDPLQSEDDVASAQRAFRDAVVALAQSSPELCGLLIVANLGYVELTLDHTDKCEDTTTTARYFLGIKYGQDVTTVTKTKTTTRRLGPSGARR